MKLIDKDFQPSQLGLPASYREWWDLGDGFEIYVSIGEETCSLGVAMNEASITLEIAENLDVDTRKEVIKFGGQSQGCELYLTLGIDCVVLNYTKPKNYKGLLKKIEKIIDTHFR